jgi:hypothetical protein
MSKKRESDGGAGLSNQKEETMIEDGDDLLDLNACRITFLLY